MTGRLAKDCATFSEVEVGDDSTSGQAVRVCIEGEWHWIPYSQIEKITRDPRSKGCDSITMSRWIAQQKGLDV